jgi:hypothetical protein
LLAQSEKMLRPSAAGLVMFASALAKTITSEASLGLTEGHAEALMFVDQMLMELSSPLQETSS